MKKQNKKMLKKIRLWDWMCGMEMRLLDAEERIRVLEDRLSHPVASTPLIVSPPSYAPGGSGGGVG